MKSTSDSVLQSAAEPLSEEDAETVEEATSELATKAVERGLQVETAPVGEDLEEEAEPSQSL